MRRWHQAAIYLRLSAQWVWDSVLGGYRRNGEIPLVHAGLWFFCLFFLADHLIYSVQCLLIQALAEVNHQRCVEGSFYLVFFQSDEVLDVRVFALVSRDAVFACNKKKRC
jgi:hypothetical protein